MRKMILSLHVTPDGFCNHHSAVVGEDWMSDVTDYTEKMGTVLFGRVTFQLFEEFWPKLARERNMSPELIRYADMIARKEKIVVSKTLNQTDWANTTFIPSLDKEVVDQLKAQEKGDIIVFGGPNIISQLIQMDAFDEYYFALQPVLAGSGARLFTDITRPRLDLELLSSRSFSGGVMLMHYRHK